MNCVEMAKTHVDEFGDLSYLFGNCCKLYSMTTENIAGFLKKYNLNDKRVLTVAGSGDQRLNAYLMGASEVTCFDINGLCKLQLDLKDKAIQYLEYEDFLRLFGIYTETPIEGQILDVDMFHKIEDYLDEDTYSFFYYVLCEKDYTIHNSIYYPFDKSLSIQQRMNAYLNPDSYYLLRHRLRGKSNRFIHVGIDQLSDIIKGEKYDLILLSNISDYTQLMWSKDSLGHYKQIIDQLALILNDQGIMQVGYVYSRYGLSDSFSDFRINSIRSKYFPFGEYMIEYFDSFYGDGTYDKAIVYQKTLKK